MKVTQIASGYQAGRRHNDGTHMLRVGENHADRVVPTLEALKLKMGEAIVVVNDYGTAVVCPDASVSELFETIIPALEQALECRLHMDADVLRRIPTPESDDEVVLGLPYGNRAAKATILWPESGQEFADIRWQIQKLVPSETDVTSWCQSGSPREFDNTMAAATFAIGEGGAKTASSFLYGATLGAMAECFPQTYRMGDRQSHDRETGKTKIVANLLRAIPEEDVRVQGENPCTEDIDGIGLCAVVQVVLGRGFGYRYSAVDILVPKGCRDIRDISYRVQRYALKHGAWVANGNPEIFEEQDEAVSFAYNLQERKLNDAASGAMRFLYACTMGLREVLWGEKRQRSATDAYRASRSGSREDVADFNARMRVKENKLGPRGIDLRDAIANGK